MYLRLSDEAETKRAPSRHGSFAEAFGDPQLRQGPVPGIDVSRAVAQNKYYGKMLKWDGQADKIRSFLKVPPTTTPQDFAWAVAAWQFSQGFHTKDIDGVIGPSTWAKLQKAMTSVTLPAAAPSLVGVPVLHLTQLRRGTYTGAFTRTDSGYEACIDNIPDPGAISQLFFKIAGRLMIEEKGTLREVTAAELKNLRPGDIQNLVHVTGGVSNATNHISRMKSDGSFETESWLVVQPGTRRIHVQVSLDTTTVGPVTVEAFLQRNDLDSFLALIDLYEKRGVSGRAAGACTVARTRLEFLSSVRKMFQPADGSPLTKLFDRFLYRNRETCRLADVNSPEGRKIHSFETLCIEGEKVDIGHVLVGIEASRAQKPGRSEAPLSVPVFTEFQTEAWLTWTGDLASALVPYAADVVTKQPADLQSYLNAKAKFEDLRGDIDGINIGAVYDARKTLAQNLSDYYQTKPFRRFRTFLGRLTDESGYPLLTLGSQKPPRLDKASRDRVADAISVYCWTYINFAPLGKLPRLTEKQAETVFQMVRRGSREMEGVVDYFCNFIEMGLAREL